ncbi:MAG: orotidine-5'-phosphate decarboxylase [Acetobacteraceae bacterium]
MRDEIAGRLIVALDVPSVREAQELVGRLDGVVSFFKVGFWLLLAEGAERLIDDMVKAEKNVFLDCKMYDIGETVKRGVERARERGIRFVTVHGENQIMRAAVEGKGSSDDLKILAVTVLTSLDQAALRQMGYALTVEELLDLRVRNAVASGIDGIIAAPRDQPDEIRKRFASDHLIIATPGIRPQGAPADDHKRAATPAVAIMNGADYLIVGRPIIAAPNPASAAQDIIDEMRAADSRRRSAAH